VASGPEDAAPAIARKHAERGTHGGLRAYGIAAKRPILAGACHYCPWGAVADVVKEAMSVPRGFSIPDELAPIAHANVSADAITEGWDEFPHIVATIEQGWRSSEVLERLGSSARGESVHALQRQICARVLPARRGRRAEELIATSGALTLVTNCVMAWNTLKLQRAKLQRAKLRPHK
jgi:hypothetical protein